MIDKEPLMPSYELSKPLDLAFTAISLGIATMVAAVSFGRKVFSPDKRHGHSFQTGAEIIPTPTLDTNPPANLV